MRDADDEGNDESLGSQTLTLTRWARAVRWQQLEKWQRWFEN